MAKVKKIGKKYIWVDPTRRPLASYVKSRRCAQCYGPMKERQLDDGTWELYCPRGCQPGGHVSETWVASQRDQGNINRDKVANAYPELDDRDKMSDDDIDQTSEVLWPD